VNFDPDLRHYFEVKVIAERGLSLKAIHTAAAARGQFHQHFKRSFYVLRSQKRKKIQSSHEYLFTLLGSVRIKAVCKMKVKLIF